MKALELITRAQWGIWRAGDPGEIQVRGPGVFHEYWNLPEVTAKSFDDDWFKKGDMAVLEQGEDLNLESLRNWCRDWLSTYKIPKRLLVVDSLPRNAMGKITKPAVKDLF